MRIGRVKHMEALGIVGIFCNTKTITYTLCVVTGLSEYNAFSIS